jgi:hypothetical protein
MFIVTVVDTGQEILSTNYVYVIPKPYATLIQVQRVFKWKCTCCACSRATSLCHHEDYRYPKWGGVGRGSRVGCIGIDKYTWYLCLTLLHNNDWFPIFLSPTQVAHWIHNTHGIPTQRTHIMGPVMMRVSLHMGFLNTWDSHRIRCAAMPLSPTLSPVPCMRTTFLKFLVHSHPGRFRHANPGVGS